MTAVVWLFAAEEGGGRQDDDDAGQNMSGTMERGKPRPVGYRVTV
jgi:hypothetical protein